MEQLFIIESGIKRKAEKHNCSYCDKEFLRRISKKTKKYCSDDCRKLANKIELICDNCGKKIFKTTSKLKNSKHGFYFCNRECKEKAQSFKGNCPEIRPSHYGTSNGRGYKNSFKKYHENYICEDCKEDKKYLLQLHHKDGNHKNNIEENFEIVCSNCHIKRHLKKNKDEWGYCPHSLTPRELLNNL